MNRLQIIILLVIILFVSNCNVYAEYITNDKVINEFNTIKYNIKLNANDGYFENSDIIFNNNSIILPIPIREGYSFSSYKDDFGNFYSNSLSDLATINNKNLTATWNKNKYKVIYYLNDQLLFEKEVEYMEDIENIDIQYLLDKHHKFIKWDNYVSKMPNHDINLYAVTSEI